ncbi:MAG: hypothetical protein JXR88_16235 [Clostridia bacterium]|nr:hypothetical protein [Clostridia bacterium]
MRNNYKILYVLIAIVLLLYLVGFTLLNNMVYGSIMQVNVPILMIIIIIPLYLGFKGKNYRIQAVFAMAIYITLIMIFTYFILPDITYDEAVKLVEDQGYVYEAQTKKNIGEMNYFYAGDYWVKTQRKDFTVDVNSGKITEMEE